MPTYITVDATTNKKAIRVKTNDLFGQQIGTLVIDYRENLVPLTAIRSIVLEDESNGINMIFVDGSKYTLSFQAFSRVGTEIVGVDILSNSDLLEALITLTEL